jgi:tetratricopeptide (TPR) repeat protein
MGLPSRAQLSKTDSLAQVIDHYPANDTTKMNRMVLLAKMLAYSDPSRGMKIIDAEMPAARQLHFKKGILEGYNVKSSLYFLQGNREQAQAVAEEYLQTATRYSDKPNKIAANSLLGVLYSQSGNYAKALEYMLTSLKLAEQLGDKSKLAALNQNLGNVYNDMEDYDRAIGYYKNSIATFQSVVPKVVVPPALYNNIGSVLIHQRNTRKHWTTSIPAAGSASRPTTDVHWPAHIPIWRMPGITSETTISPMITEPARWRSAALCLTNVPWPTR